MDTSASRNGPRRRAALWAAWAAVAAVGGVGCSGGSPTPPPPPSGDPVTISGIAASGAALGATPVSVRCASGSGSAVSGADGAFSVTIAAATLPCLLKADAAAGALFGVAQGSGTAVTAHVTPFTQLVVARTAAALPATAYAAFDPAAASRWTASALQSAQDTLRATLTEAELDLTGVDDWLTGALSAGAGRYDAALEAFSAQLAAAGSTLAAFTQTVVDQSTPTPSPVPSLPAALQLRPAAATCGALRSGRYRVVMPLPGGTLDAQSGIGTFDAPTMTYLRPDGSTGTWAAIGPCRFADSGTGWTADIAVVASGVWTGRASRDGGATYRPLVALPAQAHTVAELTGPWQQLGLGANSSGVFAPFTGTTTFDGAGVITAGTECRNDATWSVANCTTLGAPALALFGPARGRDDGGYDLTDLLGNAIGRVYGFRAGGGYLMLVGSSGTGFSLWAPQVALTLPAIGTTNYNLNVNVNASLLSTGTEFLTTTVQSQDAAAGSWTRVQQTAGTSFSYVSTLFANTPREGLVFRPAGQVTTSDGRTVTASEFTFLRLPGMGLSPGIIPAPRLLQLSGGVPAP